ncbi:MAG TPA: hypothetical protein VKT80_09835 [Chloroflexota bacterium]|nr:hypothetical protein [Chloroflexota bacterium]
MQETLFGLDKLAPRKAEAGPRDPYYSVRRRRNDWSRVTRDPAVATSYTESTKVGVDFRLGLARALSQLTPDQRQALRATIEGQTKRQAA